MRVYIVVAEGFECVETLSPIDVMHRAGVEVVRVAVGGNLTVVSSHKLMSLECDRLIEECDFADGDALILPGGNPGYINLRESELVLRVVRDYYNRGKLVAAICGAPTVLAYSGVAKGSTITCHASVVAEMKEYDVVGGRVVECGNLITAAGAGVSVDFALAIADRIVDSETMLRVRQGMMVI
jgi:4-methyl-5(b-hydroxyethyl)-thiazole monophosphate biosynthesis